MRYVRQAHTSQKTWRAAPPCPIYCDTIPPIFLTAPPSYAPIPCYLHQWRSVRTTENLQPVPPMMPAFGSNASTHNIKAERVLVLCQDERAKASQAPMRHAWSDAPTQKHVGLSLHRQHASPCQRGTGSCCALGDMQRTASLPQPQGFALGCSGHAVRAHDCRSQQFAP
jgi:hypothetical protein